MPDCKTHKLIGAGTGAVFVGYRARNQSDPNWWIEVIGGAIGGYCGGLVPDVLEPAISSWHRGVAHSCATGGGIVAMNNALLAFAAACRENADKCGAIPMAPQGDGFVAVPVDPITQLFLKLAEVFWRFLAGFVNGLAAGYISHLVLDARTPRSIPLLKKGF